MATRVLHGTANIANIPFELSRGARAEGLQADSYTLQPHAAHEAQDHEVGFAPGRERRIVLNALRFALRYDVFHFHFGQSLLGAGMQDVPWLARLGKQLFFHFHGCDLRDSKKNIATHEITVCKACWPQSCSANRNLAIEMAERYGRATFVSTPDLLEFYDGSLWLPQSVDIERMDRLFAGIQAAPRPDNGLVRVAHSPTSRVMKGSQFVIDAVENLRARGVPIELVLVENMTHAEALATCASADLVVDQLQCGWYGTYAVEMMAMRKPVVCFVRRDIADRLSAAPPVISADPFTIEHVLEQLVEARGRWREIGERGRRYVEAFHDRYEHARYLAEFYGRRRSGYPEELRRRYLDKTLAETEPPFVPVPAPTRARAGAAGQLFVPHDGAGSRDAGRGRPGGRRNGLGHGTAERAANGPADGREAS